MMRLSVAMIIVAGVLSGLAHADELTLVKGKGVCVCEANLKNLKTMPLSSMACDREKYYPQGNGITRPKWTRLDLSENRDLMKTAVTFLTYGDKYAQLPQEARRNFEDAIEFWLTTDSMYTTDADIANTGVPERLLLYSRGVCMGTHLYAKALLVLDKDKNQVDVDKTRPLLQNVPETRGVNPDVRTLAAASSYMIYGVFVFKHTTFFDKWNIPNWTLSVYQTNSDSTKEICRYKYKRISKTSSGMRGRRCQTEQTE